jgi:hypothetical protein
MSSKNWLTAAATFGAATMIFGAAALAQTTPTPGATSTPQATGTVSAATATVGVTGTVTSTVGVTATATVSGTGTITPVIVPTIPVSPTLYQAGGTGNFPFAHPAFETVWNRTDRVVKEGRISRTWFWGPGPNSLGLLEQYNESTAGNQRRLVQYFDKSRMEVNDPAGDRNNPFFVTNGLLTVELISGFIQVGNADFMQYRPACIPMSGDFGDLQAPTYFAFQGVSNTTAEDNPAPDRTGQRVTETIDRNGVVGNDPAKASIPGITLTQYISDTKHNIPAVFWDFLNSSGPVYTGTGQIVNDRLINPWFFASGLPISEPYWAKAKIAGTTTDVMIQAYERRALTYVPSNPPGFQVEMANIGQHYFDWRYRNYGYCPGQPVTTPTPPVPAPTAGTPVATGTVVSATGTVIVTGTPAATGTVVSGTASPQATSTVSPAPTSTSGVNAPTATASPSAGR